MTLAEAETVVAEFERDELKAILGFAYGNFSGGEKLADAATHFAVGLDHLIAMRATVLPIIAEKLKGQPK